MGGGDQRRGGADQGDGSEEQGGYKEPRRVQVHVDAIDEWGSESSAHQWIANFLVRVANLSFG